MNRIDQKFQELRARKEPAFIPFITAGDPNLQVTKALILELERRGADIVELGIPFSDPIADGPVIQASYYRALSKGIRLQDVFAVVKELRRETEIPLLSMVSYSIVFSKGREVFIQKALEAGFDGATIPDLPVEESEAVLRAAEERDFRIVCFVAPTTTPSRMDQIVKKTQGFLYYISVVGITGVRDNLPQDMRENILKLKELTNKPVALGFGVSTPEQARAVGRVADGVIVGSAIMKEIERNLDRPLPEMTRAVGDLAARLAIGAKGKIQS
ncbi:MAG: tryptophan synthase subunit alpha [Candidatus Brocadiales bacterium]|nr:tryptophan synthase subunit alpha [Candidatus Brocadiales bacterium]